MTRLVIDASALVALFFEEEHSAAAEAMVGGANSLLAPDLIWAEAGNAVWKRYRRGEIAADDAQGILSDMLRLPLRIAASERLLPDAVRLAVDYDRTVYDCLYLAVAIRDRAALLTGDERFCNALRGSPLEQHIAWLGAKA